MSCGTILVTFLALLAVSTVNVADATSQEKLILKVYNPDYHASDEEMRARLDKADLEGHGYKKEQTTKLVTEPGNAKPVYEKKFFYYKIVDCSRLQEIIQELETLMPDSYNVEMDEKINKDINLRGVTNMKSCKVGLEVHFKNGRPCTKATNAPGRKRRRAMGWCWGCGICYGIEAKS